MEVQHQTYTVFRVHWVDHLEIVIYYLSATSILCIVIHLRLTLVIRLEASIRLKCKHIAMIIIHGVLFDVCACDHLDKLQSILLWRKHSYLCQSVFSSERLVCPCIYGIMWRVVCSLTFNKNIIPSPGYKPLYNVYLQFYLVGVSKLLTTRHYV